ncbi:MAG TPA: class I SAM-dependent methyltransferase [Patescibacteria group bacterium]|nr:class I SAM-dependent methyltransferase [Patescibacteria group bacterium]
MEIFKTVLFCVAAFLLLWNVYILIFNKGVPNIRTAPAIRKRLIALLKEDMAARGLATYTIYDMGSGNGLLTREIAAAIPTARVIGVEFSKQCIEWSNMMKKRKGLANLEYRQADFFEHDFSDADAVVVYLSVYEKGRVGEKLMKNLRPGTLVTSNRFPLGGGWEAEQKVKTFTLYPFQKYFYVYHKA